MVDALDASARLLHDDPRRAQALALSAELSKRLTMHLRLFSEVFEPPYSSVSGSTGRNTHLPHDLDFDLALLPVSCAEWKGPLQDLVHALGMDLATDNQMCEHLSRLFDENPARVRASLLHPIQQPWPPHVAPRLATWKYRLASQDRSMIEVSAGTDPWLRVFVHFNDGWAQCVNALSADEQVRVISHVCLMKFLAKCSGIYGEEAGAPGSRGYEVLVMDCARTQNPVASLMAKIVHIDAAMTAANTARPRDVVSVRYPIRDDVWIDAGFAADKKNVLRSFSIEGWRRVASLARAFT